MAKKNLYKINVAKVELFTIFRGLIHARTQHVPYNASKFHVERSNWTLYKGLAVAHGRKQKMHDSLKRGELYVLYKILVEIPVLLFQISPSSIKTSGIRAPSNNRYKTK